MMLASIGLGAGFQQVKANEAPANRTPSVETFPLYDLHVHTSVNQTQEQIVEKAKANGIEMFGLMQNVAPWGIKTDEDLQKHYESVKDFPGFIALQPVYIGWSKNLTKETIDKFDYILMDPQWIPNMNKYGDQGEVWDHNCYVPDEEAFMERNMEFYLEVINNPEPLDIFGWPLYLPPSIAPDYYRLWTKERMEIIIEAARKRGVAFEINDLARTPHAEFILMAKKAGCKFTFGSDTRDHRTFRLDYCKQIANLCGLTRDDFYIPVRKERK
jgi:histidinol phosphatase-like PHP family hydrolase